MGRGVLEPRDATFLSGGYLGGEGIGFVATQAGGT